MVAALVFGAGIIRVPYYVLTPGDATAVEPLISVRGAPTYHHPGSILFTTVSVAGEVSGFGWLRGRLNADDQVISREQLTGGVPAKTYNQENVQAMTDSKTAATKVALGRLGYPVRESGDGAEVVAVAPKSAADGKLQTGDVITAVDGQPVMLDDQAVSQVHRHRPGDVLQITVHRGDQSPTVALTAGDDGHGVAKIGVALSTHNLRIDFPVQVNIDTGKVGGPSAGLAFTLALLDDLAPDGLTGGKKVAVTGTIDLNGQVGPVGGVAQKTVAARRAGAVAFLVPPQEAPEAKRHAGPLRIITVRNVDEALAALAQLGGHALPPPTAPAPH